MALSLWIEKVLDLILSRGDLFGYPLISWDLFCLNSNEATIRLPCSISGFFHTTISPNCPYKRSLELMAIVAGFAEEASFLSGGLTRELSEHARPTSRIACHSLKTLPFSKGIVQRPPSSEKCGTTSKL